MSAKRYAVRTVVGYPITNPAGRRGGDLPPGCSASVMDTAQAWTVVRTFRSEDRNVGGPRRTRGVLGAVKAAEALADELNREAAGTED